MTSAEQVHTKHTKTIVNTTAIRQRCLFTQIKYRPCPVYRQWFVRCVFQFFPLVLWAFTPHCGTFYFGYLPPEFHIWENTLASPDYRVHASLAVHAFPIELSMEELAKTFFFFSPPSIFLMSSCLSDYHTQSKLICGSFTWLSKVLSCKIWIQIQIY